MFFNCIDNGRFNLLDLANLNSNFSIETPFGLSLPFTTISKVKQGTISDPILCCSWIGDYPEYCLKTEKSAVIEKKNYPPIAFVDEINSITNTIAKYQLS